MMKRKLNSPDEAWGESEEGNIPGSKRIIGVTAVVPYAMKCQCQTFLRYVSSFAFFSSNFTRDIAIFNIFRCVLQKPSWILPKTLATTLKKEQGKEAKEVKNGTIFRMRRKLAEKWITSYEWQPCHEL